jgi:hypothetical protein
MNPGRSIQSLAQEIDRQNAAKRDFLLSTTALALETEADAQTSRLRFNVAGVSQSPVVSALAHDQLGTFLDIPGKFYDRLHTQFPSLLDHNVNTLLQAADAKRMVRTLDGRARAFLSDRYRRMDNFQLLAAIVPTFADRQDLKYASCEVTERRLYVKVTTESLEAEVKKGDVVRMGLCIRNSEVGLGRLSVDPFLERLICTNGATIAEYGMKRNHSGKRLGDEYESAEELFSDEALAADDKAFFLKVRDLVKATLTDEVFKRIIDDARKAAGEKITGDVPAVVEELADRFTLRDAERAAVLRNLIDGGDLTRWGALNAVTRVANDLSDYDRSSDLETIGGRILNMPPSEWSTIANAAAA